MTINPRWGFSAAGVLLLLLTAVLLAMRLRGPRGQAPAGPGRATPAASRRDGPPPDAAPRGIPLPAVRRPRVVIEKSAHRLTVYDGDRPVKCYRVAIGGGTGDKVREGDRCTPEGQFHVCLKNPKSRFTRSLGLSYPNIEDAERGLRDGLITRAQHDAIISAIRQGRRPPWKTPLGGEIVIHGAGTGRDWTAGCVATSDADIVELYDALPVGTTVTIVP